MDLLSLQGQCKTDPESYADEFALRLRHFRSLLVRVPRYFWDRRRAYCGARGWACSALADVAASRRPASPRSAMPPYAGAAGSRGRCTAQAIFSLAPTQEYKEFAELVSFLAQASLCRLTNAGAGRQRVPVASHPRSTAL
jgi:hypothetical protein